MLVKMIAIVFTSTILVACQNSASSAQTFVSDGPVLGLESGKPKSKGLEEITKPTWGPGKSSGSDSVILR